MSTASERLKIGTFDASGYDDDGKVEAVLLADALREVEVLEKQLAEIREALRITKDKPFAMPASDFSTGFASGYNDAIETFERVCINLSTEPSGKK